MCEWPEVIKFSCHVEAFKCDAVNDEFTCVDFVKKKYKCRHCGHVIGGVHQRRKIYHFLPELSDGSTKACKLKDNIDVNKRAAMKAYIEGLNETKRQRNEKRNRIKETIDLLNPAKKFQSTLNLPKKQEKHSKKDVDLAFARMIVMSICRSVFFVLYFIKN